MYADKKCGCEADEYPYPSQGVVFVYNGELLNSLESFHMHIHTKKMIYDGLYALQRNNTRISDFEFRRSTYD